MKYRKDKRTENLTLRDIHVGDWVQVWSEIAERYSPPLKITQICDDGTIYLVTSDEERPTPWEEDIKNVDALPITKELLQGFGFEVIRKDCHEYVFNVLWGRQNICELCFWKHGNCCSLETQWGYVDYFHDFIDIMCDKFPEILNLEWKGVQS